MTNDAPGSLVWPHCHHASSLYHWDSPPPSHFYSGEYFENNGAMDPKIVYRTTLEYSSLVDWNRPFFFCFLPSLFFVPYLEPKMYPCLYHVIRSPMGHQYHHTTKRHILNSRRFAQPACLSSACLFRPHFETRQLAKYRSWKEKHCAPWIFAISALRIDHGKRIWCNVIRV